MTSTPKIGRKFGESALVYWATPKQESVYADPAGVAPLIVSLGRLYPNMAFKMSANDIPFQDARGRYLIEDRRPVMTAAQTNAGQAFMSDYGFTLTLRT